VRRGPWVDIDLADLPEALVLVHPGWTNDRESLAMAIREGGWFPSTWQAFHAAENADLKWGWIGVNDQLETVLCNSVGATVGTDENVNDVRQVTLALVPSGG
jgi:hypothetical protein